MMSMIGARWSRVPWIVAVLGLLVWIDEPARAEGPAEGTVLKAVVAQDQGAPNRLQDAAWQPWKAGFKREGGVFVCDNGADGAVERGASQTVVLDQRRPDPIIATVWSQAEGVAGTPDNDYALYVDLIHDDGTPLYGQTATFATGTHDWQEARVVILPERPVRSLTMHLLLRGHAGKARFREPALRVIATPAGAYSFDGVPVIARGPLPEGFQIRDVAAGGPYVRIEREALGVALESKRTQRDGATFFDVTLRNQTGSDRALSLVYSVPIPADGTTWLDDPRRSHEAVPGRDHVRASRFRAGGSGRLSFYPMGAVTRGERGTALAIDMARPAFFRAGYQAGTGELYLAYDLALTPEKPEATLRFCRYDFDPAWGFRAAWARYQSLFPEAFTRRVDQPHGLWMPFAPISKVPDWEDFGFAFKEGNGETDWDDARGILTFRYTEPLTWWMPMPADMPRTRDAAEAEARRLAAEGNRGARAFLSSGYHDAAGSFSARLLDTPWNNGAVWSMNSMPGIAGEVTDFKNKWNAALMARLYSPLTMGMLDGEYVDSSEGYVTDELDYRRDHFATARTPLVFDPTTHQPAIFRGLIAFEYVRAIADDIHKINKSMMANSTPDRLCWLAPSLDVLGSETDWNPEGRWRPMSEADLLYRRALCGQKPYCFLMNTDFDRFGPELVERYMKRALAYGMFPGFFSPDASNGHYFSRPELYDRDRPFFRKYIPLCQLVSEAGWEPITRVRSSDEAVHIERFGARDAVYLTVFNDSAETREAILTLDGLTVPESCRELLKGGKVAWKKGRTEITIGAEDVMVLEIRAPRE